MGKRFAKQDWTDLGLTLLAQIGPDSLTIEELCNHAGKTRGSFYFHFETSEDFLKSVVDNWYALHTEELISGITSNSSRLDQLNQLAARLDLDLEAGIRQLASRNPAVQEIVTQADAQRVEWLAGLYGHSGKYDKDEALALAKIEYAAFIGFKLVEPSMSPTEARNLYDAFLNFTGRA